MEGSRRAPAGVPGSAAVFCLLLFSNGLRLPAASDCNQNAVDDLFDIATGTSKDCNSSGVPDECDLRGKIDFVKGPATELDFPVKPTLYAAADLDGDKAADLIFGQLPSTSDNVPSLRVLRGDGAGGFTATRVDLPDRPLGLAAGDFDGDSSADVAVGTKGVLWVLLNRGGGRLGDPLPYNSPSIKTNVPMLAAGMDRDRDLDLVSFSPGSQESTLTLMLNGGKGDFDFQSVVYVQALQGTSVTSSEQISAAELNGDGAIDIVTANRELSITWNSGNGIPSRTQWFPGSYTGVATADMDGDGAVDLLAASAAYTQSSLTVLLNLGDGAFPFSATSTFSRFLASFAVFDADADGHPDAVVGLVSGGEDTGTTSAQQNQGSGALRTAQEIVVGGGLAHLVAADFDADGRQDVAAIETLSSASRITVIWNRSLPPSSRDENENGVPDECGDENFHRGDPNDDGRIGVSDAIFLLAFLFQSGEETGCRESSDANDDGSINISDPIFILQYLFLGVLGGGPLPPPGAPDGPCGKDPAESPAFLGCGVYKNCP